MDRDRKEICRIISQMLDHPEKDGIYHTSTCYTQLEHYIEVPEILDQSRVDLKPEI